MTDHLKQLMDLVPPPSKPMNAGSAKAFLKVEAELSLKLPADYKALVHTYGSGKWQEFWSVLNPFTANKYTNLIIQSGNLRPKRWSALDAERAVRERAGKKYPHPIYPESGGILPWAITDNGGRFYWLTKGNPSKWPTIYYPSRDPDYESLTLPCVEIVLKTVAGKLKIFGEEFGSNYKYSDPKSFCPSLPCRS